MAIFDSYVSLPEGISMVFFPNFYGFPQVENPRLKAHVFSTPSFQNPKVVEVLERGEGPDTVQRKERGFLWGWSNKKIGKQTWGFLLGES